MKRTPVADFLRARREILQPEDVGLPRDENRRVPGLRREEVAELAGISSEYYLRLEQGRDHQPSDQVMAAISRALRLDQYGFEYLHRLAHPRPASRSHSTGDIVSPEVMQLLQQWSATPAYLTDRNHDILAVNAPASLLAPGHLEPGGNILLSIFATGSEFRKHSVGAWENAAGRIVAALRFHGDSDDRRLQQIVGALSVKDRDFRRMWASHDARPQSTGIAPAYIQSYGWVNLHRQTLEVPGETGQFLTTYFGSSGSREAEALEQLAARVVREGATTRSLPGA